MINVQMTLAYLRMRHPALEEDPDGDEDTLIYHTPVIPARFQLRIEDGDLVVHSCLPWDEDGSCGENDTYLDPYDSDVEDKIIELCDEFIALASAEANIGSAAGAAPQLGEPGEEGVEEVPKEAREDPGEIPKLAEAKEEEDPFEAWIVDELLRRDPHLVPVITVESLRGVWIPGHVYDLSFIRCGDSGEELYLLWDPHEPESGIDRDGGPTLDANDPDLIDQLIELIEDRRREWLPGTARFSRN